MIAQDVVKQFNELTVQNKVLAKENTMLKDGIKNRAEKFYVAKLGVEVVAVLHGVHPDTVRKYVALGCIEKHPDSTDAKILIRASEALMLDFKELRKKGRYTGYSK